MWRVTKRSVEDSESRAGKFIFFTVDASVVVSDMRGNYGAKPAKQARFVVESGVPPDVKPGHLARREGASTLFTRLETLWPRAGWRNADPFVRRDRAQLETIA